MAELNSVNANSPISTLSNNPQSTNFTSADAKKSLDDYINTIVNNLGSSNFESPNLETDTTDTPMVDDQDTQDTDSLSDLHTSRSPRKKRRYKSSLETISESEAKPQETGYLSEYSFNSDDTVDNESMSDCSSRISVINNNDRNMFLSSNYKFGYEPSPSLMAMHSLTSLSHEPVRSSLPNCVSEETSSVQMIYHKHEWEVDDDFDRLLSETSLKLSSCPPSFKSGTSVAVSSKSGHHIVGFPSQPSEESNCNSSISLLKADDCKSNKTNNSVFVEDKREINNCDIEYEKEAVDRTIKRKRLLPSTHYYHDQQAKSSGVDSRSLGKNEDNAIIIIRKASTVDIHSSECNSVCTDLDTHTFININEKNINTHATTEIRKDDEAENCDEVTRDIEMPSNLMKKRSENTKGKNVEEDLMNKTNSKYVFSNLLVEKAQVSLPQKIQELNRFSRKESTEDTHRTYPTIPLIRSEKDVTNILAQSTEFLMTPIQLSNSSLEGPSSDNALEAYVIHQNTGLEDVNKKQNYFKNLIIEKKTLDKRVNSESQSESRPNTPGDLISFEESLNAKLRKSSSNEKSRKGSVLNLMDAEIEELPPFVPTATKTQNVDEIGNAVPPRLFRARGPRAKFEHEGDDVLERCRVGDMYLQTPPLVPTPYTRDSSSHATQRATGDALRSQEDIIDPSTLGLPVHIVNPDSLIERRDKEVGHRDVRTDEILIPSQSQASQPCNETDWYDSETVVTTDGIPANTSLDVNNVRYIRRVKQCPLKVQKNSRGYRSSTDTSYSSCSSVREKHKYRINSNEIASNKNSSVTVNTRTIRYTSPSHLKEDEKKMQVRNEIISETNKPNMKNKLAKFSAQLDELKACVQDSNKYLERCLARGKSSDTIKKSEHKCEIKNKKAGSSSSTDAEMYNTISSIIRKKAIKCIRDDVKRVEPSVGRLTSPKNSFALQKTNEKTESPHKRISTNKVPVKISARTIVETKRMEVPLSLCTEKKIVYKTVGKFVESARASPVSKIENSLAVHSKDKSKAETQKLSPTKDNKCGVNKKIEKRIYQTDRSVDARTVGIKSTSPTKRTAPPSTLKTSQINTRGVTKNDVQSWVAQSKKYIKSTGNDFGDVLNKEMKSKTTYDRPHSDTNKKSRKTFTRTFGQNCTKPTKEVSFLKKNKQNSETLSDEPNTTASSEYESPSQALTIVGKHNASESLLDGLAGTVQRGLKMRNMIKRSPTGRMKYLRAKTKSSTTSLNTANIILHQLKSDTHHLLPEAKSNISQTISKIVDSISEVVDTSIDKRVCWDSSTDIVPCSLSDRNIKRSVTSEKIVEAGNSVLHSMTDTLIKKIKRRSNKKRYLCPIQSPDTDVETEISFNSKCEMEELTSDSIFSQTSSAENINASVEQLISICSEPIQSKNENDVDLEFGLLQSKSGATQWPTDKEFANTIIGNVKVPSQHAIAALEDLEALLEGIGGPKKPNNYCQRRTRRRRMKSHRVAPMTPLPQKTVTGVETEITPWKQKESELVKMEIMGDATVLTTARLPTKQLPPRPFTTPSVSNQSSCLTPSSSLSSIALKNVFTVDFDTGVSSGEEKPVLSMPSWPYGKSLCASETSSNESLIANHSNGSKSWLNRKDYKQKRSNSKASMSSKYDDSDERFSLDSNTYSRCSNRISQLALPNQRRVMQTKSDFQHVLKKPFIDRLDKIIQFKGSNASGSVSSVSTSARDWRTHCSTSQISCSRPPTRRKETETTSISIKASNIEEKSSLDTIDITSKRSIQLVNKEIRSSELETTVDVRQELQSKPNLENIEVGGMVVVGVTDQSINQRRSLSSTITRIPRYISNMTTSFNPKTTRSFKSRNYIQIDLDTWNAFTNNCIANFQKKESALILGCDSVMDTLQTSFTVTKTLSITSSQDESDDLSFRTAGTHFSHSNENLSSVESFDQLSEVNIRSRSNQQMLTSTNETQDRVIVDETSIVNLEKLEPVRSEFSRSNDNLRETESFPKIDEVTINSPSSHQSSTVINETQDELVESIEKHVKSESLYCSDAILIGLLATLASRKQHVSESETSSSNSESDLSEDETKHTKMYRAKDTLNYEITLPLSEDCSSTTLLNTVKQLLTTDSESSSSDESSDNSDMDSDDDNGSNDDFDSNKDNDSNEENDCSEKHDSDAEGHTCRSSKLTPIPRETLTDVLQTMSGIFNQKRTLMTDNVIKNDSVKTDSFLSCQKERQSDDESCNKTRETETLPLTSARSNVQEDSGTEEGMSSKKPNQVEFVKIKQPLLYAEVSCSAPVCYLLERYDTSVPRENNESLAENPVRQQIFVGSPPTLPPTTSCQYLSERFVSAVSLPVVDIISSESFQNILSVLTHMPRQQSVDEHESPVRYTNYLRSFSDQTSVVFTEFNKEQRVFNNICPSTSLVALPQRPHGREEERVLLQIQSSSSTSFDDDDILDDEIDVLSMLEAPEVIASGGGGDSSFRDLPDDLGLGWLLDENSFSDVQVGVAHHTSSASVEVTDSVADATLLSASSSSDSEESVPDNRLFNSTRSLASLTSSYRHQSQEFDCAIYALLLEQYSMKSQLEAINAKLDSEILAEDVLCSLNSEEAAPIKAKTKITKILFFVVSVIVFVVLIYGTRYPPVCQ